MAATPPLDPVLRAYLGAFLPPAQVDQAARAATDAGSGRAGVLAAARDLLRRRVRLSAEVEALVLVEDAGLTPGEAGSVVGLTEAQVRAVLLEAADETGEPASVEAPPAPTAMPVEAGPVATERRSGAAAAPEDGAPGVDADPGTPDAALEPEPRDDTDELPVLVDGDRLGAPRPQVRTVEPEEVEAPTGSTGPDDDVDHSIAAAVAESERRRSLATLLLAAGLAILILGAVAYLSSGNAAPGTLRSNAGAPGAGPSALAVVPNVFELRGAVLTGSVEDGEPGPARYRFGVDEDAHLWISYDYLGAASSDAFEILWMRQGDSDPLYRHPFPLPQGTDVTWVTLRSQDMGEPGAYRADIAVNGVIIRSLSYTVEA